MNKGELARRGVRGGKCSLAHRMALTELNVFATAATSIDEAVSSVFIEATTDEQRIVGARGCEPVDVTPCEAINLHGNCIRSLAHSLHAPNLTSLNLSSNNIEALDGSLLAALPRLAALDLSSNAISKIEGYVPRLQRIYDVFSMLLLQ